MFFPSRAEESAPPSQETPRGSGGSRTYQTQPSFHNEDENGVGKIEKRVVENWEPNVFCLQVDVYLRKAEEEEREERRVKGL